MAKTFVKSNSFAKKRTFVFLNFFFCYPECKSTNPSKFYIKQKRMKNKLQKIKKGNSVNKVSIKGSHFYTFFPIRELSW